MEKAEEWEARAAQTEEALRAARSVQEEQVGDLEGKVDSIYSFVVERQGI